MQPVTDEPPVLVGKEHAENISKTLEHILDVLRGSTIAEEGGNDPRSKFWATYKKVSNEYDSDFLDRATDDMAIILTFAGLFSAVNSTFIVGMQPNPSDTTNTLMVQLIQVIANGPDAIDISNLSTSSTYPSSTVWMQILSYASLAFSVLAAFGAVMGKQWINSYKSTRGRGSLEERGLERQKKLEGLERWGLETILGALLVLLQISLFLFGLSLSANMFHQEVAISSVIIGTTAFGMIFYLSTVLVSVLSPYCPFQSPGSKIIKAVFKNLLPVRSASADDSWRAIRWLLQTSTNPDFVSAAGVMIPQVHWPEDADIGTICGRLCDTFKACDDKLECVKGIAHFWAHSVGKSRCNITFNSGTRNSLIRDAFDASRHAWEQFMMTKEECIRQRQRQRHRHVHKATIRTALRTMVVCGGKQQRHRRLFWLNSRDYELSLPNDNVLRGDLKWYRDDRQPPPSGEFNWLFDYLEEVENPSDEYTSDEDTIDDEDTIGDALFALSSTHGLSSDKLGPCIKLLIRFMGREKCPRIRQAAFRVIDEAREDFASITSDTMPQGVDESHLNDLSRALLSATDIVDEKNRSETYLAVLRTALYKMSEIMGNPSDAGIVDEEFCDETRYLRLIFVLTASNEWRRRLSDCGYVERCNSLADVIFKSYYESSICLQVAGILLHFDPSGTSLSRNDHWPKAVKKTWNQLSSFDDQNFKDFIRFIHLLPGLVNATRPRVFSENPNLSPSVYSVGSVLCKLQNYVGKVDESTINHARSAVQSLHDGLPHVEDETIETGSISATS